MIVIKSYNCERISSKSFLKKLRDFFFFFCILCIFKMYVYKKNIYTLKNKMVQDLLWNDFQSESASKYLK